MLTLTPPLPSLALAALMPTLELVRRHARDRRHRMQHGSGFYDETLQRNYTASETSLTLLLEHVLGPILDHRSETVNGTEQLQLAVGVLSTLLQSVTPADQAAPQIRMALGRRCLLPQHEATVLVQVTLAVIQAALLDEALFLVVTMPRQTDAALTVEVEADTAGLAADNAEARCFQQQLVACLAAVGGALETTVRPEGSQVTIRLPLAVPAQKAV